MITRFKIFEQLKFSEGDYVLINLEKVIEDTSLAFLDSDDYFEPDYDKVKIIFTEPDDDQFPYICEFPDGKNFGLNDVDILRKLTDKEIEEYKNKKTEYKFNV